MENLALTGDLLLKHRSRSLRVAEYQREYNKLEARKVLALEWLGGRVWKPAFDNVHAKGVHLCGACL